MYWSAQAYDEASLSSIAKGWKKLLKFDGVGQQSVSDIATVDESPEIATSSEKQIDVSAVNGNVSEFESLFDRLGYADDDRNWSVPNTWLMEDANDPGYQIMNDEEIVDVLQEREKSES